jgi:hypothetical protein
MEMNKKSFRRIVIAGVYQVLLMTIPFTGFAELYPAVVSIPKINAQPALDGLLNEKLWDQCVKLTDFVVWTLDAYTREPVTVYLGYDKQNIFIGFKNSDPEAAKLLTDVPDKRLHDTFLWGRHHSRITLSNGARTIALMADPKGTMADWGDGDMAWNGNWQFAASIGQDSWIGEFIIPFSDFGLDGPPDGESWSLSISRNFPTGESAQWTGTCNFSEALFASFQFGNWQVPEPGKNMLNFEANNSGKNSLEVNCEIELIPFKGKPLFINQLGQGPSSEMELLLREKPLRYSYRHVVEPGNFQKEMNYDLPSEGSYYATATCRDEAGNVLFRKRGFWFTLEPNAELLEQVRLKLGRATATFTREATEVSGELETEGASLFKNLEELLEKQDQAWKNNDWIRFSAQVQDLEGRVDQYVHKVRWSSLKNWQERSDFGLTVAHPVIKIMRDQPFPETFINRIDLSAARNEYESFQLVVLPFGKDIHDLEIQAGDLYNNEGAGLSGDKITVSLVDYNLIDWQADYVADKGWHPDPLLPVSGPVSISGTQLCQPFWITVYVPPDTPAGIYQGEVTVSSAAGDRQVLPLQLRVWNFGLPVESHLKTHSWDNLEYMAGFYNMEELPVEWYLRFCDLLLKNRMNPGSAGTNYISQIPDASGKYDFSRVEKILDFCLPRGLNRFSIIQLKKGPYEPDEAEKVFAFIEAYAKFLREKGWMDKALIELWDEPTPLEWKGVKERAERIRKIDPDLRLQLFAEGGPYSFWEEESREFGLAGLIDIWAPWRLVESPETQAEGGEIWTYFCTLARGIAPNFYIDRPAIYQRLIAWYCWMYGVDGFEHWSTNYFWRNVKEGLPMEEKWPHTPWDSRTYHHYNGEGQLIYPGPDGWPLPSIRLENFRDSMEDYEYLYILNELIEKHGEKSLTRDLDVTRQLLKVENYLLRKYPMEVQETQENTILYPDQPERILDIREKIAAAIETIGK